MTKCCTCCITAWKSSISCHADDLLFVYGSLRSGARLHPVRRQLMRRARCLGRASLAGRLFRRGPYPAARPSGDPAERVLGELWQLRDRRLWGLLDRYEECAPDSPRPHPCRREPVLVQGPQGTNVEAWVYWYRRPVRGLRRIHGGDFLAGG